MYILTSIERNGVRTLEMDIAIGIHLIVEHPLTGRMEKIEIKTDLQWLVDVLNCIESYPEISGIEKYHNAIISYAAGLENAPGIIEKLVVHYLMCHKTPRNFVENGPKMPFGFIFLHTPGCIESSTLFGMDFDAWESVVSQSTHPNLNIEEVII